MGAPKNEASLSYQQQPTAPAEHDHPDDIDGEDHIELHHFEHAYQQYDDPQQQQQQFPTAQPAVFPLPQNMNMNMAGGNPNYKYQQQEQQQFPAAQPAVFPPPENIHMAGGNPNYKSQQQQSQPPPPVVHSFPPKNNNNNNVAAFPPQEANIRNNNINASRPIPFGVPVPSAPVMLPGVVGWKTGLFDCMDDPTNTLITAFVPCITFGQVAEIVDGGHTSCGTSGMLYGLIWFFLGLPFIMSCTYRTKLRAMYGMAESPAPDWITHFFCECCALCQEYRELQLRGYDPSIGWLGNQQAQQYQQASMAPPMNQTMRP